MVAATAVAAALATSILTAMALNNDTATAAQALEVQNYMNQHLRAGNMIVNQRVDIIKEVVQDILDIVGMPCVWNLPGICVTL